MTSETLERVQSTIENFRQFGSSYVPPAYFLECLHLVYDLAKATATTFTTATSILHDFLWLAN